MTGFPYQQVELPTCNEAGSFVVVSFGSRVVVEVVELVVEVVELVVEVVEVVELVVGYGVPGYSGVVELVAQNMLRLLAFVGSRNLDSST